jgi:hypothetical protein
VNLGKDLDGLNETLLRNGAHAFRETDSHPLAANLRLWQDG